MHPNNLHTWKAQLAQRELLSTFQRQQLSTIACPLSILFFKEPVHREVKSEELVEPMSLFSI